MRAAHIRRSKTLDAIAVIPGVLLACVFLFLGVVNLISPDVPSSGLGENTRVCAMLILVGTILTYALFRPHSGGFFLCIAAVPFGYVFHFHPFYSAVAGLILLLGVLSIIRGRPSQRTSLQDVERAS
jgi:hypothetical protein